MSPVIAILGAESTGKTTLAYALALELRALGTRAVVVREYLREFCDARGCTPQPHEQAAIAAEQWRRTLAAAQDGSTVVADTTPLMIALYSQFLFADESLRGGALALQRRCTHTLLTGLDLPWQADGLQRDGPQVREPVDALIRGALAEAAIPHSVIYGSGPARTAAALAAVRPVLGLPSPTEAIPDSTAASPQTGRRLSLRCRECLVPDCEHLALTPKASQR
ncbi:MAG: ATP-binding protein [Methylibium sp.]|uniref:ATP-binding protein n=1 Tax=Methylibium sp. TaxID=2067992 RepID=UPI0017F5A8EE|nr:ATP-binding protein [Methylibium sp.]MBA3596193.1 ATP-binding protein [Methylibium sp.]